MARLQKGINDLLTVHPDIAFQWHPYKNGKLKPSDVTCGSNRKVMWICSQGHEWIASVNERTRGFDCPVCTSRKVLTGFNDLKTLNPTLAAQWHPTKNGDLTPDKVTVHSNKKVWWMCSNSHEWQASVNNRSQGRNCPYCANKKVLPGYNDLATVNPDLATQWHPTKNTIRPTEVTIYSNKQIWWLCSKGHEWKTMVKERTKGNNCPYCGNQKLLTGFNDLATVNPVLTKEWNYEKNGALTPSEIIGKSGKTVWWKCSKGHEWKASVANRANGRGCPYCSNQKSIIGENDLKTLFPEICKEWDYSKNNSSPENYLPASGKKVWWLCSKGHSWKAVISSRTLGHTGCPVCSKESKTSFCEQAVYFYIKQLYPDAINGDRDVIGMELDIYIPSIKCAIEYDGLHWHEGKADIETKKNELCANNGIDLIRLREQGLSDDTEESAESGFLCISVITKDTDYGDILESDYEYLERAIYNILVILGKNVDNSFIDIERDRMMILSEYIISQKEKSLAKLFPETAKQWNYDKNSSLTPYMFTPNSNKKVWWKCEKGHEWEAVISSRVSGRGCPYCSNKKPLAGYNTLEVTDKELLEEWDYSKNTISPNQVLRGSDQKIWWKCKKCGYEWSATLSSRTTGGKGCPGCRKEKVQKKLQKPVINLDTCEIFQSAQEASEATKINIASIRNCCLGISHTAGGYHWKYHKS